MRKQIFAALTIAALGLSLPFVAEAGPTVQSVSGMQVALNDSCTATVTWEPLNGGKPLFARVIFQYADGSGEYTTFLVDGADDFHKVKQNAGSLEVDFAAIAATQPAADSYQVLVNFVDRKDNALSDIMSATSACAAI
jgi:hypothetical protein